MRFCYLCLLSVLTLAAIASCSTRHASADQGRKIIETYYRSLVPEAAGYVAGLQQAGRLPGIAKNDHGQFHVLTEKLWDDRGQFLKQEITFPVSLTINLCHTNAPAKVTNVYYVTKDSRTAEWHLDGAWRLDEHGKFAELK